MNVVGSEFHYRLGPDARSLGPMRRALTSWLVQAGARDVDDVVLVVNEATANSVEHAGLASGQAIVLNVSVHGTVLRVDVCDPGDWMPPSIDRSRGRGHGLTIMRKLMDDVDVHLSNGQTRVVMTRSLA